jgi:hypothetical protein
MIRFFFRFLASAALAVAVIMAVLDATRTVATSTLVMTPLGESWAGVSPDTLAAAQTFVETGASPMLWDPVAVTILALPGFAVFAVVALLLYMIGHRPRRGAGRFAPET